MLLLFYLHELLLLLLPGTDGFPDALHLLEDGLRLLRLEVIRGAGHLAVDSVWWGEISREGRRLENMKTF